MSIKYKVVKQVFGFDQSKTPQYVAKAVPGQKLSFDKVCIQVAQICGVHRSMSTVIISGLFDVLVNNLDMGHSIELGDFATLRPGIRAKAQKSMEQATAKTIYRRRVNFVPGKMLSSFLNDVSVSHMTMHDWDYTNNSSDSE